MAFQHHAIFAVLSGGRTLGRGGREACLGLKICIFHPHDSTKTQHFFPGHHDLPVMISVVDTREKIEAAIDAIAPMLLHGLIVLSDAEVIRLTHSLPKGEPPPAK
jgi:hypothetical protein